MSAAAKLIERLDRVKETGSGRWIAKCPSHEDRSPSLSIRELGDGRVLVHDFGGCEVGDVLTALGLTLSDLFPERLAAHSYPRTHLRIPACDLLEVISEENIVVAVVAADMLAKRTITNTDWRRLAQAVRRIGAARDHFHAS